MKKLFLTSAKLDALLSLISGNPTGKKVAFIPTAGDPYEDKWFIELAKKQLSEMGFELTEVDLKDKKKDDLLGTLQEVDIVFVAGGNTFYLLEKVRESGFDQVLPILLDKGIIYAGESAGAVLACPTIEPVKFMDEPSKAPNLKSFEGLGLVDFVVLPHYGTEFSEAVFEQLKAEYGNKGFKLIPLTNDQSIIVENDSYKIV